MEVAKGKLTLPLLGQAGHIVQTGRPIIGNRSHGIGHGYAPGRKAVLGSNISSEGPGGKNQHQGHEQHQEHAPAKIYGFLSWLLENVLNEQILDPFIHMRN